MPENSQHSTRYNRNGDGSKKVHRQTTEVLRFKLTGAGFKAFQSTFGNLNISEMYRKIRSEQKADTLWYQNETGAGRLTDTSADVAGVTQVENKHCGGFQNGVKTPRMESKQTIKKKR